MGGKARFLQIVVKQFWTGFIGQKTLVIGDRLSVIGLQENPVNPVDPV